MTIITSVQKYVWGGEGGGGGEMWVQGQCTLLEDSKMTEIILAKSSFYYFFNRTPFGGGRRFAKRVRFYAREDDEKNDDPTLEALNKKKYSWGGGEFIRPLPLHFRHHSSD